jgi:hypothetical protein
VVLEALDYCLSCYCLDLVSFMEDLVGNVAECLVGEGKHYVC